MAKKRLLLSVFQRDTATVGKSLCYIRRAILPWGFVDNNALEGSLLQLCSWCV